ncbi:hypothetical protein B0H14DRAFT_2605659 [Mycena olivaceomarginata]|nr:hypothetical protein B0H14DRAFT_2605659 [Mycena olivaceomarginata]
MGMFWLCWLRGCCLLCIILQQCTLLWQDFLLLDWWQLEIMTSTPLVICALSKAESVGGLEQVMSRLAIGSTAPEQIAGKQEVQGQGGRLQGRVCTTAIADEGLFERSHPSPNHEPPPPYHGLLMKSKQRRGEEEEKELREEGGRDTCNNITSSPDLPTPKTSPKIPYFSDTKIGRFWVMVCSERGFNSYKADEH